MTLAAAVADVLALFEGAGVRAVDDIRDLNPPCAYVIAPEGAFRFDRGRLTLEWVVYLVVGNTGAPSATKALSQAHRQDRRDRRVHHVHPGRRERPERRRPHARVPGVLDRHNHDRRLTMATTADGTGNLGPGTLKIGMTGTEIDVSCLMNDVAIDLNITAGDSKRRLCGNTYSKPDTLEPVLSGNVDVDAGKAAGFFALCAEHWGEVVDFTFTPSTAMGTVATGQLKLVPLRFGADAQGDYLNSDFEFALVDFDPKTAYAYGDAAALDALVS